MHPNFTAGSVDSLALNIDLAPTILDIANATIPGSVDGESLMVLMNSTGGPPENWRGSFLIEQLRPAEEGHDIRTHGVRTGEAKWVQHVDDDTQEILAEELYDLVEDPYEMQNLLPSQDPPVLALRTEMMLEYEVLMAGAD